jgi:hypothetical protein
LPNWFPARTQASQADRSAAEPGSTERVAEVKWPDLRANSGLGGEMIPQFMLKVTTVTDLPEIDEVCDADRLSHPVLQMAD